MTLLNPPMSTALRWPGRLGRRILDVPLVAKIIGANVIIVAAAIRGAFGRSGLASVQDRVTLSGGAMQIQSVSNGGTRVTAEMKTTRGTP